MPSLTFNEFQRELRKRNIPEDHAFIFTLLYERFGEMQKEHEFMASICTSLADNMRGLVQLNEQNVNRIKRLSQGKGMVEGVDVDSVAIDPREKN